MLKPNGKTAALLLLLGSLFQKQRQMQDASSGKKKTLRKEILEIERGSTR
jgi:hypothetical protein